MNLKKTLLALVTLLSTFSASTTYAQDGTIDCANGISGVDNSECLNTIFTAIPFLRINPDGRTGAMGDAGIAISPDASAVYHNLSKIPFAERKMNLSLTFTPWLRGLIDDMYIGYVNGYYRLDEQQGLGFSLRYFDMGSIQFTNDNGDGIGESNPNEFALDFGYARKLSEKLSLGLNLKYVYSNLARGQVVNQTQINAAHAAAADVSMFYTTDIDVSGFNSNLAFGANLSNIGNKVSYQDDNVRDFLPINLGLGTAYTMEFDEYNKATFAFDLNKLMVPTPTSSLEEGDPDVADYREKALLAGMFGSFGDAPGGFSEELNEFMISTGIEYWYDDLFAIRGGYFHEAATKGNRKYMTLGLGVRYNVFGFDFSYLVPVQGVQNNPLQNTLRFTFQFNLDEDR